MMNLKLALRSLFKTPFVTIVAIVSLALGIGANAAIFSLFDQLILRSLPVQEPGRLVNLSAPGPKPGSQTCNQAGDCDDVFSYPMFRDLEKRQTAVHRHRRRTVSSAPTSPTGARRCNGEGMLRLGQLLSRCSASSRRSAACSARTTIGRSAVTTSPCSATRTGRRASAPIPNVLNEHDHRQRPDDDDRRRRARGLRRHDARRRARRCSCRSHARRDAAGLDSGFDERQQLLGLSASRASSPASRIEQARDGDQRAVYQPIINDVEAPLQKGMSDQTMARSRRRELMLEDGRRGQSSIHGEAQARRSSCCSAITGIVLLIACANIANLLLARAAGRAERDGGAPVARREPPAARRAAARRSRAARRCSAAR